ncbi:malectin domain-containing carbohydrate-binding protein, partial [Methylomonas sp. SURF-1]
GAGVQLDGAYQSSTRTRVENNTIVATGSASAIQVQGGSSNVRIRNNILDVRGSGYALNVASDSQQGYLSDYNLFMLGASAKLAYWEDRPFANRTDWFYEVGQDRNSLTADARFIDIDGADGQVGWNGNVVEGSVRIVDDGDPTFATTGSWSTVASNGSTQPRGGDVRNSAAGDGSSQASWSFDGLTAGYYRVAATWPYQWQSSPNFSSNSTFRIYDGEVVVGADVINQNANAAAASNGYTADGNNWDVLGVVRISGASLKVVLDNLANGIVHADAVRIERLAGDFGQDDDLHLQNNSPAIDRGDPNSPNLSEPRPNGGRVDLGAYGNTAQANLSPDPLIQILSPNGLEKFETGVPVTVNWRSDGLLPYDSVFLLDAGQDTGTGVDNWQAQQGYRSDGNNNYYSSISAGTAIDLSGAGANAAPEAMYRSYAYTPGGVGNKLGYQIAAQDGGYQLVLHFAEPSNIAVGSRLFDIVANGTTIASNVDVRALAGGINKALVLSYDINIAGGQGLSVELVNKTNNSAILSGLELRQANANGVANPVLSLEASTDNGASWTTVATGLTMDRYGRGQTSWTPTAETVGNSALLRITATINPIGGSITVSDSSDEGFLIANAGKAYYVNDGSLAGDEYTTAVG